jgi:dTDP-4-dehydrorhamnose 3,5-epimerase
MKKKNIRLNSEPLLITGELCVDDRGELGFVNGFNMSGIKRFYSVKNHKAGFIRAWHAHKNEEKYVTVISGAAVICAVLIDDWDKPSKKAKVHRFVLSANKPSVVFIPKGYANGFMNLEKGTKLMFFSTSTIDESKGDDFRYDAYYWDPWKIVER